MPPQAPLLLLALAAAWCGTLWGGATAAGASVASCGVLALLAWWGAPWRDPLRLGAWGRLLPPALWLAAAASWSLSPVRRAGTVGLLLLPAYLLLAGAIADAWREEGGRRVILRVLRALSGVVAAASLWSLADRFLLGSPRAAMPLGHHNLLAVWVVTLLPLAVLPARERGGWRLAGILAGALGAGAVLASGSLLGTAALAVEAVGGLAVWMKIARRRPAVVSRGALIALTILLAAALLAGPRLARIASGKDPSARARSTYYAAGWEALRSRPVFGWGPGAGPWMAGLFADPASGVNPWGEAVGDLHSLPLQLACELGLAGLALALALGVAFAARRLAELRRSPAPALLAAALLGLAGFAVAGLGTAALNVTALPLAAAVAAGAALAASPGDPGDRRAVAAWPVRGYALAAALALGPFFFAQWSYDRALAAELGGRRDLAAGRLEQARRADPGFPLYPARLALLSHGDADLALRAAEDARGVPALWTIAGILGAVAGRPWAAAALQNACAGDPLAPLPPFYRLMADPGDAGAPMRGAHALLADPRLAAAVFWEGRPALFAAALEQVRAWPGVDPGWKEALLAAAPAPSERSGEQGWIALTLDTAPPESVSLLVFRRRPWPTELPLLAVRQRLLPRLALPPATTLATTSRAAFSPSLCVTSPSPQGHRSVTGQEGAQPLSGVSSAPRISTTAVENPVGKASIPGRKIR